MAYRGGLRKWFSENWVDIGSKKKGGGHKNVVVNLPKVVKENILSVYQLLKQQV